MFNFSEEILYRTSISVVVVLNDLSIRNQMKLKSRFPWIYHVLLASDLSYLFLLVSGYVTYYWLRITGLCLNTRIYNVISGPCFKRVCLQDRKISSKILN